MNGRPNNVMRSKIILIREWPYCNAPRRFRDLLPAGRNPEWLVHVPKTFILHAESFLLPWRQLYPVGSVELRDGSVLFWGEPGEAATTVGGKQAQVATSLCFSPERRSSVRIPIECPSRYETHSRPKYTGVGLTLDMSSTGIAFTTESLLPADTKATLHLTWPAFFPGYEIIELSAGGTLVRTEERKAALKLEQMNFRISTSTAPLR
jgi:hypothetical protein